MSRENVDGHRLLRLELLNWGTFNGFYTMETAGSAGLLTGANGSGKSTLVDALLTLLVPNRGRNYNQASGAGGRRERSETTYVRGAYGKVQQAGEYVAKEQYLRGKDSYSVLLAVFGNGRECLTLAQFFWFTSTLNKFYVVAEKELSIQTDFADVEDIRTLKKQLREMEAVRVYDQFKQYSRYFRRFVSLRSQKALDLFNQTITIKEIGSLNDFVRRHMLEAADAGRKVETLIANFENLTRAHEAMEKAGRQRDLLRPLVDLADKYDESAAEIDRLEKTEAAIPTYFAGRKRHLLQKMITAVEVDVEQCRHRLQNIKSELIDLRTRETELTADIRQDETSRRLDAIKQQLRHESERMNRKNKQFKEYNRLARIFERPVFRGDDAVFYDNRREAQTYYAVIEKGLDEAQKALERHQIERNDIEKERQTLETELASLRQRRTQIPTHNLALRASILNTLGVAERDIPFIGELLQVRESERVWEGAIERLLRSFALCLLVPERHYHRFAEHVRHTHLHGRIVFHRVPETDDYRPRSHTEPDALYEKLRLKPGTPYHLWLQDALYRRYDYQCCTDMETFNRSTKAITPEGLIKSGSSRHEKDDRHRLDDRSRYVLGWDNVRKIQTLEEEAAQVNERLRRVTVHIEQGRRAVARAYERHGQLEQFLAFEDPAEIDWQAVKKQIDDLKAERKRLVESSNRLQQLQAELEQVQAQIATADDKRSKLEGDIGRLTQQIESARRQSDACERELDGLDPIDMKPYVDDIRGRLEKDSTLATIEQDRRHVESFYRREIRSRGDSLRGTSNNLIGRMRQYKDTFSAESTELDADVEASPAFRAELERIEHDDLPRYERRFKTLLDKKMTENISFLQAELSENEEAIRESLRLLNHSLRQIDYTADTYIQLQTDPTRDPEIRAFRNDLHACLPDVGRPDYEQSFQRIKSLIDRFKEDVRWTAKVIDVRQWLDFSASERYRADDTQRHYYSDSTGKSGGQKAKLAYTILASAIAYQYGLDTADPQPGTFRFVVIDEAFSRSDERNSRYAMELFETLGLQLLVVTPLNGIQIVEPYVNVCHFVRNSSDGDASQVINMPMEEVKRLRTEQHGEG